MTDEQPRSSTYLERRDASGFSFVALEGKELAVGSSAENALVVDEPTVSRLHAVFERIAGGWTVRDLGSRNGTFVDGQRIVTSHALRDGQEVRIGGTTFTFHTPRVNHPSTRAAEAPPDLTPRERDVLRALCRPLAAGDIFTEPASLARIAAELSVTDEAVKQHLRNLYAKFGLHDAADQRRRVRLANEAIRRGAIGLGELRG
jgi:DNA-binding CsgD family transcriptional regulator